MSSTNEAIPLPPPTEIFAAVKESCKSLRETSGLEISQPAIQDFLSSLEESEWSFMSIDHGTKVNLFSFFRIALSLHSRPPPSFFSFPYFEYILRLLLPS